ncbi:MAG: hypothetical protein ACD_3C00061G0002 [uncultured bacterium (gcode 4)]|uniref:Uncharacterized protein n=1 Tax=uncultured bacterium (gcode 4) TaxID=1234023 RepID=K2FZL6_9BACT|nr:MAG: hypothetical protein ACD_3C00061G0002 [uncultured bacterium (gcode 4)]
MLSFRGSFQDHHRSTNLLMPSHTTPCFHTHPTETALSGEGKVHDLALEIMSHLCTDLTADTLTVSRADLLWFINDMLAIVARIAKITIVTISSTRVKAFDKFRESGLLILKEREFIFEIF